MEMVCHFLDNDQNGDVVLLLEAGDELAVNGYDPTAKEVFLVSTSFAFLTLDHFYYQY